MLTIYYARENINKDKFMYDRIGITLSEIMNERLSMLSLSDSTDNNPNLKKTNSIEDPSPKRVLLIVPEQFTLQAERNAFEYLDSPGFIDLDVLSTSSLSRRLSSEKGGDSGSFINQYGKQMLIAKLLYNNKNELVTFRGLENSTEFASKINDMISELKMFNVTPEGLLSIAESMKEEDILGRKLRDVAKIYSGYEEAMSSNQLGDSLQDAADLIKKITSMIFESKYIQESEIWISGYDYFSPAMKDMIEALRKKAHSVGILLTADPSDNSFRLTNSLMDELSAVKVDIAEEGSRYLQERPEEISFIEKNLFAVGQKGQKSFISTTEVDQENAEQTGMSGNATSELKQDITNKTISFVEAGSYNAEAETAASRIAELIRDYGYRYKDILILCNDLETRGDSIKRVFAEYNLPIFIDQRRSIDHNPVLDFILSLPDIVVSGRKHEDVFRLLKTGLTDIQRDEYEELENYVISYKIKGKQWDKDFEYGKITIDEDNHSRGTYSEEEMSSLNKSREYISKLLLTFEESFKKSTTAKEKSESILCFLKESVNLPHKIEVLTANLEKANQNEYAAEMSSVLDVVTDIFEQMITILGDIPMPNAEYATVLRMGFDTIRIGMLPTGTDQIVLGTMQRTRTGEADAMFVLGVNDGVLPSFSGDDGILNDDEKQRLENENTFVGRRDETVVMEEQLAIYRNFSKPKKMLYLSYCVSDSSGKDLRPAMVFNQLKKSFPDIPLEKDIVNNPNSGDYSRIQAPGESIVYLTDMTISALNESQNTLPDIWSDTWLWFSENDENKDRFSMARKGLSFKNRKEIIDTDSVVSLLNSTKEKEITTSPSTLEKYSKCPFSWFLSKGLRLAERRIFEVDSRNMGDVYHNVLMQYGRLLSNPDESVDASDSKWKTITQDESKELIHKIFRDEELRFSEGILKSGGYERYKSDRMVSVLADVAWAVTEQVRGGEIKDMFFESTFNNNGNFPPITFEDSNGKVDIRGQIDRLDILNENYALVTDYKSSSNKVSLPNVKSGWQLQLMTYLTAVSDYYTPVGVSYFEIKEPRIDVTGKNEVDVESEIKKSFVPEIFIVNDSEVNNSLAFKLKKSNTVNKEEFDELRMTVKEILGNLCGDMMRGKIDVNPKSSKDGGYITACTYCEYSGICNYDALFD